MPRLSTNIFKRYHDLHSFRNGAIGHSDGAYLVENGAKIRVGGRYFLSDFIYDIDKAQPKLKGPIHQLWKMLKNIVASASECEIASAFENV